MRSVVRYALGATLALTLFALWRPAKTPAVVDVIQRNLQGQEQSTALLDVRSRGDTSVGLVPLSLPSALPDRGELLQSSARDFFVPVTAPVQVVAPPPTVVAPIVDTPPPAPTAPAMTYRYLGRMVSPEGNVVVYLVSGQSVVPARIGERLDSGYLIEAVNDDSVRVVHPLLDARVAIPLPTEASR